MMRQHKSICAMNSSAGLRGYNMSGNDIRKFMTILNEGLSGKLNEAAPSHGSKFDVFVFAQFEGKNNDLLFKKSYPASNEDEANKKALAELSRAYDKGLDVSKIKGWEFVEETTDRSYMDPDSPYSISHIEPVAKAGKEGKLNKAEAIKVSSQTIAEVLHGQDQMRWFNADLDGLAYDGDKEEALHIAKQFEPISAQGRDFYFVDAKAFDNDGDMGWYWILAPKM